MGMMLACQDASPVPELPVWTVAETPELSLGGVDAPPAERFGSAQDALVLPDGGIAVLDSREFEIRFFDPDGSVRTVQGRRGEGPGEFRAPWALELVPGDSVVAWDYVRDVLSFWSTAGDFLGERPSNAHRVRHEGDLLPDGSIVVPRYGPSAPPPSSGRYRPHAVLVRYADSTQQEFGDFPFDEILAGSSSFQNMPFNARPAVAAGGSPLRIVVAENTNSPLVRIYDDADHVEREFELFDSRRPVTDEMWAEIRGSMVQRSRRPEAVERDLTAWGRPEFTPAFESLHVDAAGRIWAVGTEDSTQFAIVHDAEGAIARVELPALERIFEIGEDYILGMKRGDLDVHVVQRYRFTPHP
ncbi:MAG: hypothetical protein WEA24_09500 [Gemmatimonadota bacterium]